MQIQFSVDHQFARPLQLDFMSFIYNAARTPSGETNLATKIEIFDAQGRSIVNTPMRPLSNKGLTDLSRISLYLRDSAANERVGKLSAARYR